MNAVHKSTIARDWCESTANEFIVGLSFSVVSLSHFLLFYIHEHQTHWMTGRVKMEINLNSFSLRLQHNQLYRLNRTTNMCVCVCECATFNLRNASTSRCGLHNVRVEMGIILMDLKLILTLKFRITFSDLFWQLWQLCSPFRQCFN